MDAIVVAALEALRLALAKCQGRRPSFLQLLYPDGTIEQYGLCEGSMAGKPADATDETVRLELTERERSVLAVLARAERPLKGRTIATRAGIRYNSHFRDVMSGLKERKLVVSDEERRYWPADRPWPTPTDREG
jgi:hypothetical protein